VGNNRRLVVSTSPPARSESAPRGAFLLRQVCVKNTPSPSGFETLLLVSKWPIQAEWGHSNVLTMEVLYQLS
jgi:hypothetical protein